MELRGCEVAGLWSCFHLDVPFGSPLEFVRAAHYRTSETSFRHMAFKVAELFAIGTGSGELQGVALHRSFQLQFVQGSGELVSVQLEIDIGMADFLAEADEV